MSWVSSKFNLSGKFTIRSPFKGVMNLEIKIPLIFWCIRGHCTIKTFCNFQNSKLSCKAKKKLILKPICQDDRLWIGMADTKLTFRHGVEIPKRRCFETLLQSVIRNTHVTWLRRIKASGRFTSVSRPKSAFDRQGREQTRQLLS